MATATMGLRRRVHQVSTTSSTPSTSSASASTSSNHSGGGGGKRTRSDNNNSPSQGNLNSPEPAPKKARNSSRVAAAKAKELEMAKKVTPPHWSDTRQFASIAGLSLQDQAALCSNALPSPVSYLSSQMATFVGNAAASLGKAPGAAVSYLDISNMTAGAGPRPNWPNQDASTADPISLAFSAAAAFPSTSKSNSSSSCTPAATSTTTSETATSPQPQPSAISLPKNFPNDAMFNTYQPWVIKTYGDLAKTKTITIKKYARILRTLRGEEVNSAENSKFRFWVKSKGFHIGQPEGYEAKPADRIIGRHAVSTPGLDPPLYVPTQPPHNKALNGAEGTVPPGRVYKKVAIVENFFDIIHAVHVDLEGRPGKHAGQKRTYRTITETYAFLPREAVTRFLLGCTECQRRPRTPSPTTTAAAAAAAAASSSTTTIKPCSPSPTTSPSPTPDEKKDEPASPKPATATMTDGVAKEAAEAAAASSEQSKETSAASSTEIKSAVIENEDKPEAAKSTETMTPAATSAVSIATTITTTTTTPPPSLDAKNSNEANSSSSNNNSSSCSEIKASSEISTSLGNSNLNETAKLKTRDEKYNPLSITNLLRKDPVKRRSPPIITTAYQPFPTSNAYAYTMTATTAMSTDNRSSPSSTYIRKLHGEDRIAACTPASTGAAVTRPWSPTKVESKYSPLDYSPRSLVPESQTKTATNTEPTKKEMQKDGQPQSLTTTTPTLTPAIATAAAAVSLEKAQIKSLACEADMEMDENAFSPTAGLIDTNLNLLATIQQLHCQVMLALTERLRPPVATSPAATDS